MADGKFILLEDVTIAVDFDGTLVEHRYPKIGKHLPWAVETVRWLQDRKARIILWTMRSGKRLDEAIKWCQEQGIQLHAANHNPTQAAWTSSPKVHADLYIDDMALGCPTVMDSEGQRMCVDWAQVRELLALALGVPFLE